MAEAFSDVNLRSEGFSSDVTELLVVKDLEVVNRSYKSGSELLVGGTR